MSAWIILGVACVILSGAFNDMAKGGPRWADNASLSLAIIGSVILCGALLAIFTGAAP